MDQDGGVSDDYLVSVRRLIPAAPADVFELLASPAQHGLIDGSGTVRGVQPRTPERLSPGAKFGMQMNWGAPYKILNEVVEFEEGRLIAWRHPGRHVWRYRLEPAVGGQTLVIEEFDGRPAWSPWGLMLFKTYERNRRSMEATMDRLEDWARTRRA